MREIKFRGYSIDDKRWVTGYGVEKITEDGFFIPTGCANDTYQVFKESIGEYTGLKDKNGVEIYEGDIVEKEFMEPWIEEKLIGTVEMIEGHWSVVNDKKKIAEYLWGETDVNHVIGNIYENPELLEGE